MRQRRLKWAMPYLQNSEKVTINYGEPFTELEVKDKTALEIGVGKGDFIVGMAKLKQEYYYIGVEAQSTILGIAAKKIDENEIENVHLVLMDAKNIDKVLPKHSIDILYLNFSDPWPKARHEKRRLTSPKFLDMFSSILKENGKIIFKTDNQGLFDYSIETFKAAGYDLLVEQDYINLDIENDVMSEYEKKFRSEGNRIYRLIATKGE